MCVLGTRGFKCECGNVNQRKFVHDTKDGSTVCVICGLVLAEGRILELGKRQFMDDPKSKSRSHHGVPANPFFSSASQLDITFSKKAFNATGGSVRSKTSRYRLISYQFS